MMSRSVLVLNSGSSSVKFQLIDPDSGASLADGIVERIGEDASAASLTLGEMDLTRGDRVADHEAALRTTFELFDEAGAHLNTVGLVAVGHRVVHGGPDLYRPTLVDDALVSKLDTNGVSTKIDQFALGYVYNLSKRTAVYTTVSRLNNKNGTANSVASGTAQTAAPSGVAGASLKSTGAEFGLRHFF